MITLQKARKILGSAWETHSDEELHSLIGFLLLLVRIEVETKHTIK